MNLRPSGYEPDELPGCSIPRRVPGAARAGSGDGVSCQRGGPFLSRPGGDLLSHVLRRSTIGATALNGRVRDGIGCFARAMTTRPGKKRVSRSCGQGARGSGRINISRGRAGPGGRRASAVVPGRLRVMGGFRPSGRSHAADAGRARSGPRSPDVVGDRSGPAAVRRKGLVLALPLPDQIKPVGQLVPVD